MKTKVWLPATSFQSDHHHLFSDASSELWEALGGEGLSDTLLPANVFSNVAEAPHLRRACPPQPSRVSQSPPGIHTHQHHQQQYVHQPAVKPEYNMDWSPTSCGMPASMNMQGRGNGGVMRGGHAPGRRGRPPLSQRPTFTMGQGRGTPSSAGRGSGGSLAGSAVTITQWRCRQCGKSYATRSGLYFHEATHTGQYKHTCFLCEKGFMQTNQYKTHLATHQKQFKHMQGGPSPTK